MRTGVNFMPADHTRMKPYQQVPILECGEPLVPICLEVFAVERPHPYEKLGAPYGKRSPYFLRQSVLSRLIQAQDQLQLHHPSWRIQIFDAYRPVTVQQFMVDYTFTEVAQRQGLIPSELSAAQRQAIWKQVYQLWAVPSFDQSTPPPHSTGAAVDVTLVDSTGQAVNMGSAIDELSARSHPDYFAVSTDPVEKQYHSNRQLLETVMRSAGFQRHPVEWWHFSFGDQMWVWLMNQEQPDNHNIAKYGMA